MLPNVPPLLHYTYLIFSVSCLPAAEHLAENLLHCRKAAERRAGIC